MGFDTMRDNFYCLHWESFEVHKKITYEVIRFQTLSRGHLRMFYRVFMATSELFTGSVYRSVQEEVIRL